MARVLVALGRGVAAGLLLGAAYRGWMRLMSTRPEFTWSGTLTIVAFVVVMTVLASLAADARTRWRSRPARAVMRTLAALSIYGVVQGLGMVAAPSVVLGALAVGRTGWPRWLRGLLGASAGAGLGLLPFLAWDDLARLGWARSTLALACYLVLVAVFARLLLVSVSTAGSGWDRWPSWRLTRLQVAASRRAVTGDLAATAASTMPQTVRNRGRVPLLVRAGGGAGGLLFAAAGAWMGSMNAGWFGLQRDALALFPLLGLGVALVVAAWAVAGWSAKLWHAGIAGRGAVALLLAAPAVYLLSWVIEFAIFGTLALGLGLILLAVAMWARHLADRVDRVLVAFAAVGSLTWNTETVSAFLLVGVGLIFVSLCLRLRPPALPVP